MTSTPKLSPSTLGTHDKRSQRQSQQFTVRSWVASQSEQSTDTGASPGYEEDTAKQDCNLTTPAIVLTEPDKEESLAKELVAPQFHPHHDKLRTHDTHPHRSGPSSHNQTSSTAPRTQPSPSALLGIGRRGPSLYPSLTLVDQPIMEEPEDEEEEEDEAEKEEKGRRDVNMKFGGTEIGVSKSEESEDGLDLETRVLSFVQSTQGQVPVVMDEPLAEVPTMLLKPRQKQSRAMSFPCESPAQHAVPLLELPSQRDQAEPSHPEVSPGERDVMETSMKPSVSTKVGKFAQIAIMAKKWKKRSADTTPVDEQQSSKEALTNKQKKRPFVEIPRAFKLDLLEEAYQIVNKTYQMYRSQLGPHHKLTLQAKEHLDNLTIQLGNNVVKC